MCFTERGWDEADACAKILDQPDEELTHRMGAQRLEQLQALLAEAAAALQASKLAIQEPCGRPSPGIRYHWVLPSGRRVALANVSVRPTPHAVNSAAGPDAQNRTICTPIRAARTDLNRAESAIRSDSQAMRCAVACADGDLA